MIEVDIIEQRPREIICRCAQTFAAAALSV